MEVEKSLLKKLLRRQIEKKIPKILTEEAISGSIQLSEKICIYLNSIAYDYNRKNITFEMFQKRKDICLRAWNLLMNNTIPDFVKAKSIMYVLSGY